MFEIWSSTIVQATIHRSDVHSQGTRELVSVVQGSIKVPVGSETMTLHAGKAAASLPI